MADDADTQPKEGLRNMPSSFQRRTLWKAITGVSMAVIACLAVGFVIVIGNILGFLQPVLVPLALAGILAYLLDPAVRWVVAKKFFGRELSRLQAVLVVFFLALTAIGFLAISVVVPATQQLSELYDNRADIMEKAKGVLSGINRKLVDLEGSFGLGEKEGESSDPKSSEDKTPPPEPAPAPEPSPSSTDGDTRSPSDATETPAGTDSTSIAPGDTSPAPDKGAVTETDPQSQLWSEFLDWIHSPETGKAALSFAGKAVNGFFGALGYVVGFFLVPVYLFFFLKDAARIREGWAKYVPLRSSSFKDEIVSVLTEVNGYLIAYFRGQVVVSFIDGVATGVILTLMGLDYAFVIGVSLAVLGVIPFVGFILTAIPAVLIAAAQSSGWENPVIFPLAVALVFIVVQQVDGIFVQPKIVGNSVGLHPLTVIFSVLFWSLLIGGILGALLAVPLTASVKVLFRRYIWEQRILPNVREEGSGEEPPPAAA